MIKALSCGKWLFTPDNASVEGYVGIRQDFITEDSLQNSHLLKAPNFDYENMCLNTGRKHASEQGLNVRNQKVCTVTDPNPNLPVKNAQQGRPTSALKSFGSFCAQYSAKDLFKSSSFFKAEKTIHRM